MNPLLIGVSGVDASLPAEVAQRVSMELSALVVPDGLTAELHAQNLRSTADVPDAWLVTLQERLIVRQHDMILEARKHAQGTNVVTVLTPLDRLAFALVNYGHDGSRKDEFASLLDCAVRHAGLFDLIACLPWRGDDLSFPYPKRAMMRDLTKIATVRGLFSLMSPVPACVMVDNHRPDDAAREVLAAVRQIQQERYAAEMRGTPKPTPTAPTVPAYEGLEREPRKTE